MTKEQQLLETVDIHLWMDHQDSALVRRVAIRLIDGEKYKVAISNHLADHTAN